MRYADNYCTYKVTHENGQHFYHFTGKCIVTGKKVTVKVPGQGLFAYRQGALIQDAFPNMSKDDREFLISGISKEGWDKTFTDEDTEEEEVFGL
jgi:hypothetical protein